MDSISKSPTQKCVRTYFRSFPKMPPPPHKLPPSGKNCRLSFIAPANSLKNRAGECLPFPKNLSFVHLTEGGKAYTQQTGRGWAASPGPGGEKRRRRGEEASEGRPRRLIALGTLLPLRGEGLVPLGPRATCLTASPATGLVTPPPWRERFNQTGSVASIHSPRSRSVLRTLGAVRFNSKHICRAAAGAGPRTGNSTRVRAGSLTHSACPLPAHRATQLA